MKKGLDLSFERQLGHALIAGVDEVGRGALAGPVGVAAVMYAPDCSPPAGIIDSKKLTAHERESLATKIFQTALSVSIVFASAEEVDQFNIRGATLRAMRRAVQALAIRPDYVLIDGRDVPEDLFCPAQACVGGDNLSASIASAAILAKVTRDRLMTRMDSHFPHYGFAKHVGYGTALHRQAISQFGLTPLHRRTFRTKS